MGVPLTGGVRLHQLRTCSTCTHDALGSRTSAAFPSSAAGPRLPARGANPHRRSLAETMIKARFFCHSKQNLRLRVGRKDLGQDLRQQPAQTALVANLRHPEYVRVLCGSLDELPAAFAALEPSSIEEAGALVRDHRDKVLDRRVRELLNGDEAPC